MLKIDPAEISHPKLHQYILASVAPRPIAFASTVDKDGNPNLSPFSFFNAVGSHPPILIFSPARSGRDNTTKNTLDNILETKEVVVNIGNYKIVQQMSLASAPFKKGVNEFIKSGLTPVPSEKIKPFRVGEAHVQFECKVTDVVATGTEGGAGNIVICEILLMHISEDVLDTENRIDPMKMDYIARMGGDLYCHVIPESIFALPQPKDTSAMGVDGLPPFIRNSRILSGNDLGRLGILPHLPDDAEIEAVRKNFERMPGPEELHQLAKNKIESGEVWEALKILMLEK